jgi:hypothetical protein
MRAPLDNQDRGLDPTVTANLKPLNHVKVEAVASGSTFPMFRGFVRSYPQDWPARKDAVSTIECEDAFSLMARYELEGQAIAEMSAGDHIAAVLSAFGWPAAGTIPPGSNWWQLGHVGSALGTNTFLGGSLQSVDEGRSTIMALDATGNMLEHLLNVAENTDRGTLYVGPSGDIVFKQKPSPHVPVLGVWGDGEGEQNYFDFSVNFDDAQWYNDIRVTRRNDPTQYVAREVPPVGSIAFDNLGASANPDIDDTVDRTSYTNISWTPPTIGLIMVYVVSNTAAGTPTTPTMSGNSLTWTQIATVGNGTIHKRITLFGANASGSTTGITTVDFGAETQDRCEAAFMSVTGVDLTGGVAAAFVQAPPGDATGTSGSITLAPAGDSLNRPISGWHLNAGGISIIPRANWTEVDQLTVGNRTETQCRPDAFETTASATWDGASRAWLGIAAELKADVPPSSADDGLRTLPVTDTLFSTSAAASNLANELFGTFDTPVVYPVRLVMRPKADSTIWPLILGMPLMSKIMVNRRPPGVGDMISLECYVIGITYNIGTFWEITWDLAMAETLLDAWYLGTPGFSELGTTTKLG